MPVKILKQEYENQFKSTSTTNWLLGNVGDWQKLTLECEFVVEKIFTPTDTLTLEDPNILILNGGETWKELGFDVGMDCTLFYYHRAWPGPVDTSNTITFTITSLLGNTLEMEKVGGAIQTTWGYQYGQIAPVNIDADSEVTFVRVFANIQPQGIGLDYGQITNSQAPSGTLLSTIDGTVTSLLMEDTDLMALLGIPEDFTHQLNFKSGLSIEKATIQYIAPQGRKYIYEIQVIFMISPFFDTISNFIDNIAPDSCRGIEALTDNFEVTGFPIYNNPNITIKNNPKLTEQEGNTGWFDENFNQLPNPFTFTPVVYKNLAGTVVSQLDFANPIVMTTTISGILNLTGASRFQYGWGWIPLDEDIYKETVYPAHKNLKISTGGEAASMSDVFPLGTGVNSAFTNAPPNNLRLGYSQDGVSGMDASDISFVLNGTNVDVSITFRPSAAFTTYFDTLSEDERQYFIWISVGDQAPDTNQSDRVSLKVEPLNKMITYVEPIGPWDGLTIGFLDHPQDENDTPIVCGNSLYLEDDLLAEIDFLVDTAIDPLTIPVPSKITYGVLMQESATGTQYLLDTSDVDLTPYPDPTQYNFDQERDFKLGVLNNKNFFKVSYNAPADVGTEKGVKGLYGFKVRWEDWIKRFPTAPNAFYNNSQLNNGLNNNWLEYFATTGWNLYFYVNITTQLGVYQNLKQMTVLDYDVNADIASTIRYYRNVVGSPDTRGNLLTGGTDPVYGGALGVIIEDEYVWVEVTFISNIGAIADWASQIAVDANVYATICQEVDNGAGQFEFRQLSSIWSPESDNPVVVIPNETLCEIEWKTNIKIIVKARIEASKLIVSPRHKITCRIGCK